MKSILITGDIHGEISRFNKHSFLEYYYKELSESTREDNVLIVCGDFGFIWDREQSKEEQYNLDILSKNPLLYYLLMGITKITIG